MIIAVFLGAFLTGCGDDKTDSKATANTAEVVTKEVAEKKVEKELVAEKKPAVEDAAKIAEAKERQMQEVKMTISSAKGAMSNAAQAGFEWTVWKKMIAKAEAALKVGDAEKAANISYRIIKQSDAALKQSIAAKNAGPRF